MVKKWIDRLFIFGTGASFYSLIETLWRGWTHWTMSVTGGLVLVTVYWVEHRSRCPLWKKCLRSTGIITLYEFIVGCIVNLRLGWNVWDYSARPLNLLGQICPRFCFFWFLLSWPIVLLCAVLRHCLEPGFRR